MRCADARRDMCPFLDDELASFQRAVLEAHLFECASCRDFVAALGGVDEHLRDDHREITAPAGLRERISLRLDTALDERARRPWRITGFAVAAVALITLGMFVAIPPQRSLAATVAAQEMVQLHTSVSDGRMPLACDATDLEAIRRFLHCNCQFRVCTHDLSPCGLRVLGATVESMQSTAGEHMILTPYVSEDGSWVTHFCVLASCLTLPKECRQSFGEIVYYSVACDGYQVLFFPNGEQLCVFVFSQDLRTEAVIVATLAG